MTLHRSLGGLLLLAALTPRAGADDTKDLAAKLRDLNATVLATDADKAKELSRTLSMDVRERIAAANKNESTAWHDIRTRADWERYRDPRIKALRASLGTFPAAPSEVKVRVARTLEGEGYRIDNIVFESRPGLWVTANLYRPAKPGKSMPGILICHSHHNPKTQSELQDMGVTWARLGCVVLVMDQFGHGERRTHPFVDEKSYPKKFAVGRQDYYFRYNLGMQLSLIGDSLIGWMVWDLSRGIDVLLAQRGVDPGRVALLGAVAGGGDPAAVTAALDPRVKVVVPFNFGGAQPETKYPLPDDAERTFNYAGGGSWESTRNLRRSAADGFLPWVIVGAAAPRGLVYAHEFAWDQEHDPVWARLKKIYSFYDAENRLMSLHGRGQVTGRPPEATHCNNIGPEHRKGIYPALKRWFDLPPPEKESQDRHTAKELTCLTPEIIKEVKPRGALEVMGELAGERLAAARRRRADLSAADRRRRLARDWDAVLAPVKGELRSVIRTKEVGPAERVGAVKVIRLSADVQRGIRVPALLLLPPEKRPPVVVGIAQEGKDRFLKERAGAVAALLRQGVAVCLVDVRGTGETRPSGGGRGRQSADTSLSATEQMLGSTLLGARLRDLRAVLDHLADRADLDGERVALWGESFAPPNRFDRDLRVPLDAPDLPGQSEPLGALLATFGALGDDNVKAVVVRGGLVSYRSLLDSPFCYVPHDAVVPGALTVGDLPDVLAALAPRPIRIEGTVDGLNRRVPVKALEPLRKAYAEAKAEKRLVSAVDYDADEKLAAWLVEGLK